MFMNVSVWERVRNQSVEKKGIKRFFLTHKHKRTTTQLMVKSLHSKPLNAGGNEQKKTVTNERIKGMVASKWLYVIHKDCLSERTNEN